MPGSRASLIVSVCIIAACHCDLSEEDTCPIPTYQTSTGLTCFKCSRGFRKVADCLKSGEQARCEACGEDWFQPRCTDSPFCVGCRPQCTDRRQFIFENCTRFSDIKCQCKAGFYWEQDKFSSNENDGNCFAHQECGAGFGLRDKGDHEDDAECEPCENGVSFSNMTSLDQCVTCRVCEQYTRACTPEQDGECDNPPKKNTTESEMPWPWWAKLLIGMSVTLVTADVATILFVVCRRKFMCPRCAQQKKYELEHENIEMTTRSGNEVNGIDNPVAEDAFANGDCSVDELDEDQRPGAGDRRTVRGSDGLDNRQNNRQLVSVPGDMSNRLATPAKTVPVPRRSTGRVRDMRERVQPTGAEPSSRDYSFPSTTHSSGSRSDISMELGNHGRQDIGQDRSREISAEIHGDPTSRRRNQTVPIGPVDKREHDQQTAEAVGKHWPESQTEPVFGERDSTLPSPSSSLSTLPSPLSSLSSTCQTGKGDNLGGLKHSGQSEHGVRGEMPRPSFEREPPIGSSTPSNTTPANQIVRPVMPVSPVVAREQMMEELKEYPQTVLAQPIASLPSGAHDLHPDEEERRTHDSPGHDNIQEEDSAQDEVTNESD